MSELFVSRGKLDPTPPLAMRTDLVGVEDFFGRGIYLKESSSTLCCGDEAKLHSLTSLQSRLSHRRICHLFVSPLVSKFASFCNQINWFHWVSARLLCNFLMIAMLIPKELLSSRFLLSSVWEVAKSGSTIWIPTMHHIAGHDVPLGSPSPKRWMKQSPSCSMKQAACKQFKVIPLKLLMELRTFLNSNLIGGILYNGKTEALLLCHIRQNNLCPRPELENSWCTLHQAIPKSIHTEVSLANLYLFICTTQQDILLQDSL